MLSTIYDVTITSLVLLDTAPVPLSYTIEQLTVYLPTTSSTRRLVQLPITEHSVSMSGRRLLLLVTLATTVRTLLILVSGVVLLLKVGHFHFSALWGQRLEDGLGATIGGVSLQFV